MCPGGQAPVLVTSVSRACVTKTLKAASLEGNVPLRPWVGQLCNNIFRYKTLSFTSSVLPSLALSLKPLGDGHCFPNFMKEQRLREGQSPKMTQLEMTEWHLDRNLAASRAQMLGYLLFEGEVCEHSLADLH